MNVKKVIEVLNKKYPGKAIFKNDENDPTEVLCELEPSSEHAGYSSAIAVIDKSAPHIHFKTTETYKVLKGELTVYQNNTSMRLKEDETVTIKPNTVHWAEGNETWLECYSEPGWTFEDHIIIHTEINCEGRIQQIKYIETLDVTNGVFCDVYEFVGDTSKDLGIIRIQPGCKTPLQKVLQGDKTIEGYISGKGTLTVTDPGENKKVYSTDDTPFEVEIKMNEKMQWAATKDSALLVYEICYPPYKDGRYENL